ncbi:MAG: hypothetical protein ABW127_10735 [Candidatus Thiodiazotropha endolucinida]
MITSFRRIPESRENAMEAVCSDNLACIYEPANEMEASVEAKDD